MNEMILVFNAGSSSIRLDVCLAACKPATVLDAANVDIKFFKEASFRRIGQARMQPILDAIRLRHEAGVWLVVTTLKWHEPANINFADRSSRIRH